MSLLEPYKQREPVAGQVGRNRLASSTKRFSALAILALTLIFSGDAALAVEEPAFQLILKDNNFEIRDYPALVVAEVSVTGDQKEAAGKGFRLLAGYIFGANQRKQNLPMPTATEQQDGGEKIAMTAPVLQTEEGGQWLVRFTMPRGYSLDNLPEPKDDRVHLRVVPPARFAVIEFSGLASADDVTAKTAELNAWIEQHHLRSHGRPSLAQYNPPWTLWFLRRNEVLIQVDP
jgi:hypothetical protein